MIQKNHSPITTRRTMSFYQKTRGGQAYGTNRSEKNGFIEIEKP